jgi:sulfatase-like protein
VAAVALGITTLCNLWIVNPLVHPNHDVVFHWSTQAAVLFVPAILDFVSFWALLTALLLITQYREPLRVAVRVGIVVFLPWILLKELAFSSGSVLSRRTSHTVLLLSLLIVLLALVFWRYSLKPSLLQVQKNVASFFGFVAFVGILVLCQLVWFGWQARLLNVASALHSSPSTLGAVQPKPRIIWIVFDELSFQQVYSQRFPSLKLPAFDQLAAESSVFANVVPAGIRTAMILPSLMTGVPIDDVRSSSRGQLSIHDSASGEWRQFDQHATVFQDALDAGYKTAVVGWYIPYCRILPEVLDLCSWRFDAPARTGNMVPNGSVSWNMLQPYLSAFPMIDRFVSKRYGCPDFVDRIAQLQISGYHALTADADRVIKDRSIDFILLHMPLPHPPGMYDRKRREYVTHGSSYLDNLALADEYLAHVRSLLEMNQQWDSSTILIMGDHSWRTKLIWSASPTWTLEDEIASHGGQFDDRPAYILKLPDQHTGNQIATPFAAVATRRLLNALINKKINSSTALSLWVSKLDEKRNYDSR